MHQQIPMVDDDFVDLMQALAQLRNRHFASGD
jgi:hypothetical protein